MVHVLVTGGVGFIGSHTVLALLEEGHSVVIVDDLSNSFPRVFEHMKKLAGDKKDKMKFEQADVGDKEALDRIFAAEKPEAVIHFAGSKAVGESIELPLKYYRNNMVASIVLLEVMQKHNCKLLVFSSSATVYGIPERVPLTEDCPLSAINPYGRTKLFQEDMFRWGWDVAVADKDVRILLLRYFNPVGAHPSGEIGEHPVGIPNNLMPYVMQARHSPSGCSTRGRSTGGFGLRASAAASWAAVALGQREFLRVFGSDYDTPDGTAIRDYISVMDLAAGHVAALNKIINTPGFGCQAVNLGTGKGTTVLEMVASFEKASGAKVPYKLVDRRPGDAGAVWAGTDLAEEMLGWKATRNLDDMCASLWKWATQYPQGYETPEPAAAK
ncbi:UDP-glucose 4-epimerase [Monoraphidium neglectum]|uniref:UDP-glucose 4-epimerase n=1 Tax=Monoraphidium neglectum TaxID=145388 RepID=A0A0D2NNI6_9CHLO|nr:UDP-glucose 4-epimerase [Monoraphidium neglectum]KIZ06056.1 UDP-glucose 4-epimerase [Monoraphidium neglectum]|eukprot:XP_013905075.1 UDP-glucose 4-epimerase [Monoraphidium neglectum]